MPPPSPSSDSDSDSDSPRDTTSTLQTAGVCEAKEHHERHNNSLAVLLSMAIGLDDPKNPGEKILDVSEDSRFPQKKKKQWNPALKDLIQEIERRKGAIGDTSKTSKQMRKKAALTFLQNNPLTDDADVTYILKKVAQFIDEVEAAKTEKSGGESTASQHWSGVVPFLRLIHALVDFEENRVAFQKSFDRLTREELDGRNNNNAMRACPWILISDKWNDKEFNPVSTIYHDLHDEFTTSIDLGYSAVEKMGELTPDKAKKKFFDLKNPLILMKNDYDKSGNGDGSLLEHSANADLSDPAELQMFNANDKRNYLHQRSPAILYLWEKAEEFKLLNTVCQQIPNSAMLESSGGGSRNSKNSTSGRTNDGADDLDLSGLQETMERTNDEVRTQSVISLLQLILSEDEKLYSIEDKLDDAPEGSRKRQRLEKRAEDIASSIQCIRARLAKIEQPATRRGDNKTG